MEIKLHHINWIHPINCKDFTFGVFEATGWNNKALKAIKSQFAHTGELLSEFIRQAPSCRVKRKCQTCSSLLQRGCEPPTLMILFYLFHQLSVTLIWPTGGKGSEDPLLLTSSDDSNTERGTAAAAFNLNTPPQQTHLSTWETHRFVRRTLSWHSLCY